MMGQFNFTPSQDLSYCEKCSHYPVCSKKETYAAAQNAVEQLSVTLPDKRDGATVTTKLSNIDWIKPIVLECEHYMLKPEFAAKKDRISEAYRVLQEVYFPACT